MDDSLYTLYYNQSVKHCKNWDVTDSHIINVVQSVMMTRDGVLQGGGFVTSVVNNDLRMAINNGDKDCINHIKVIVSAMYHSFI